MTVPKRGHLCLAKWGIYDRQVLDPKQLVGPQPSTVDPSFFSSQIEPVICLPDFLVDSLINHCRVTHMLGTKNVHARTLKLSRNECCLTEKGNVISPHPLYLSFYPTSISFCPLYLFMPLSLCLSPCGPSLTVHDLGDLVHLKPTQRSLTLRQT